MSHRYGFLHTCGHTGIGPIIRIDAIRTDINHIPIEPDGNLDTIQLRLPFRCPFCSHGQTYLTVEPGSGVLAIMTSRNNSPFADEWQILRVCKAEDVITRDWNIPHETGGMFHQMAWIPKPCGSVQVLTRGEEQGNGRWGLETMTKVACTWRQSIREPVKSRLPGMFSELSAALISGDGTHNR
jgi:hypothetical protein